MQMWEGLIQKAKDGGLDVIDTYVFWNLHEPSPGNVLCSLKLCFLCFLVVVLAFSVITLIISVIFFFLV